MKTIKNLADEIGVTKQAVFKKIKTEPFKTKISKYLHSIGNVINIDEEGEILIKEAFEKTVSKRISQPPKIKKIENEYNEYIEKIALLEEEIKNLETHIKFLEKKLEEKTKTSETETNESKEILNILKIQLETKDRQIEEKDRQIEAKDKQIDSVQDQAKDTIVAVLLSQQQNMQNQAAQKSSAPLVLPKKELIGYKEASETTSNPKMDWLKNLSKKKF
ncbi:MAG: hypothetical protein FWE02_02570 [Defluviitaleaceae bacterium]|nr:hypothetical protein [Defluviitaleaceae bacterium]